MVRLPTRYPRQRTKSGENGTGKTTFLDVLSICLGGHDDVVRLEPRDFYQAEDGTTSQSLRIELVFQAPEGEWQLPRWTPFAPLVNNDADKFGDLCLVVATPIYQRRGRAVVLRVESDDSRHVARAPGRMATVLPDHTTAWVTHDAPTRAQDVAP